MSAPVAIEWHSGVDPLAAEWDALANRAGVDPFRRPGWIGAWHEAFGRGRLMVAAARQEDSLVAVLPLERQGSRLLSPANWHTPVFGAVAESGDALAQVVSALLAEGPRRFQLSFVDSGDPLRETLLRHAAAAGYRTLDRPVQRSPYLDLEGDWEQHWRGLGSKRRNTLKRRRRKLEERGELNLRIVEGGEQLDALLEEAFRVEALGWKGERGSAIASRHETERFYRRVAGWAAAAGLLRLASLRVDGALVAFDLALESHRHHYLLKTGFDPGYRDCAPGIVLRTMMIERAYSSGLARYEFLGGEDAYKLEWTSDAHDRRRVQGFAPSPAGLAAWAGFRYGRPLASRALRRVLL